jgi:hypothetical protein
MLVCRCGVKVWAWRYISGTARSSYCRPDEQVEIEQQAGVVDPASVTTGQVRG